MATFQEIHAAADTLVESGEKPTLTALRKVLGGGSFSTISEAMKAWPGRAQAPAQSGSDELPDSLKKSITALWDEAKKLAHKELEAARAEMQAFKIELEAQAKEAFDLLETTTAQLDACSSEKQMLGAQVQHLEAELVAVNTIALVANATLTEVRRSVELQQQSLDAARAEIQEERGLARAAGELAAELRGRLAAAAPALGKLPTAKTK